jgi:hypothetical protein
LEDLCFTGLKSTNITNFECSINDSLNISFYDLGSNINERKKLNNYLDLINSVIYFVSLDDYIYLNHENNLNLLIESLDYFSSIIDQIEKKFIVFVFTKADILDRNIKNNIGLDELNSFGYDKEYTLKNVVQFHMNLFTSLIKDSKKSLKFDFYLLFNGCDKLQCRSIFFDILQNIKQ